MGLVSTSTSSLMELAPPSYSVSSHHTPSPPYSHSSGLSDHFVFLNSALSLLSPGSVVGDYVHRSKHMTLNLGRRLHGTHVPSYGRNGTIEGWVEIKTLDHVTQIELKIEGHATTTHSERGVPGGTSTFCVLSISKTLFSSSDPSPSSPGLYPISIPLPSYVPGGNAPLPPSFSSFQEGFNAEVRYVIKVEMSRKGWRRDETVQTPFLYLPQSITPAPDYHAHRLSPEGRPVHKWRTIDLAPTIPPSAGGKVDPGAADTMSAQFSLPSPLSFAARQMIPFVFTFKSSSPAVTAVLSQLTVQLVKQVNILVYGQRTTKETIIGMSEICSADEVQSGRNTVRTIKGFVRGGVEAGESSWKVDRLIEVKYAIRLSIRVPAHLCSLDAFLPTFEHQQVIQMNTHEWNPDRSDFDSPALGLAESLPSSPRRNRSSSRSG